MVIQGNFNEGSDPNETIDALIEYAENLGFYVSGGANDESFSVIVALGSKADAETNKAKFMQEIEKTEFYKTISAFETSELLDFWND